MENDAVEWIEFAEKDLKVARHLFDTFYPIPIEIVCNHCQQSAEKSVKAVIISFGTQGGLPKQHDIAFLLNQIKNMTEIDEKYYEYGDVLTPYGVTPRYPHELFLEEYHAKKAIGYAEEFLLWAKEKLHPKDE